MFRRDFLLGLGATAGGLILPYKPKTIYSFHSAPSIVEPNELFEIGILHIGEFTEKTLDDTKRIVQQHLFKAMPPSPTSGSPFYQSHSCIPQCVMSARVMGIDDSVITVRVAVPKSFVPPQIVERNISAIGVSDQLTRMKALHFTRPARLEVPNCTDTRFYPVAVS